MGADSSPSSTKPEADRLTSWKEIAAHLGKDVRTVQRWEDQYGLPVHRLGKEGGEIIWASRSELDAWLVERAQEIRSGPSSGEGADALAGTPQPETVFLPAPSTAISSLPDSRPAQAEASRLLQPLTAIALLVMMVAAGAWLVFKPSLIAAGPPAIAKVAGGQFHVFDASERLVYSRVFPFAEEGMYAAPLERQAAGGKIQFRDIDGDGKIEVLLGVLASEGRHAFYLIDEKGNDIAVVQPRDSVTFGNTTYGAPWTPNHVFALGRPGGPARIFVVFIHRQDFPTLLLELDHRGQEVGRYWSNGYVESVALADWNGHETLFVGGTSNDAGGGSLAVFRDGKLSGAAPSASWDKRCLSCRTDPPDDFIVFPTSDLLSGTSYSTVAKVTIEAEGRVGVRLVEGAVADRSSGWSADRLYDLDQSLIPKEVTITSGFTREHRAREAALRHKLGEQDENRAQVVREWRDDGYVELPKPAVVR